ncbi:hypothetical protein ACTXT7_006624 [Hymenolepis weldensis]
MDIAAWIEEVKNHFSLEEHKWYIFASFGALVAYKVVCYCYREYHLPPGPIGWPWLGYTPCLKQGAFKDVQSICKKYGPVTSFRVCGKLMVILSDEEAIKGAALENRALIGRYTMLSSHSLARGYGLFNYDGDNASSLRRILVRGIYQLMQDKATHQGGPVGTKINSILDEILDQECDKFNKYLHSMNGKPFKVTTDYLKEFSSQSTLNDINAGVQAKIRKFDSVFKRSHGDSKGQFLKFGLWNVRSCSSKLKVLSITNQLSTRKFHLARKKPLIGNWMLDSETRRANAKMS